MAISIEISGLTGTPDYDVYLCNTPLYDEPPVCIYIDRISTTPYTFFVPSILEGNPSYILKIKDSNNYETTQTLIL